MRNLKPHSSALNKLLHTFCVVLCLYTATSSIAADESLRELTVIYTNDEHGWMEGMEEDQSAAHLFNLWRTQEGYSFDGPFLVLSGGDNFTGPAISTWVDGESMVDLMNEMGYDASAVGNHEFDFGLDTLHQRADEANYPYLSANTRYKENGEIPSDKGILPYSIVEVNDLRVGIIGLTTISTPSMTNPLNVAELEFLSYEDTLRETIPQVRALNIDLLFVVAHVCMAALEPLARSLEEFNIDLIGGGHCNELIAKRVAGTVLLEGGFHFTAYARAKYTFDLDAQELVAREFGTRQNKDAEAEDSIARVIEEWAAVSATVLEEVIGYNASELPRQESELRQYFIDSWLRSDHSADIAISNAGGIRTSLAAGTLTVDSVVSMAPFDNNIVAINISGSTLTEILRNGRNPIVSGINNEDGDWRLTKTGELLQEDTLYRVLVNSFMYAGGDNFEGLAAADPNGFDTAINYRQPFLDFIREQESSAEHPIEW